MKTTVSIIVPCYNQAQFLDECLQSVLDQTYQDWECIIVNDGSPDDTEAVAKKWLEKDKRFKYISIVNSGVSNARNVGIHSAIGEFILPLDADDYLSLNYLQECLLNILNNKIKVVYGKVQFFGEKLGELSLGKASINNLLKQNRIHCAGFFRKTDWESNSGYDVNMKHGFEDWEFWINLLKRGGEAVLLEQCVLFYRVKPLSRSTEINSNPNMNDRMIDYIFIKHIELYGYKSIFELYNEKLKLENKIKNLQLHYSYLEVIILLAKRIKVSLKTIKLRLTNKI